MKNEGEFNSISSIRDPITKISSNIIDRTASIITKMDNHMNAIRNRTFEKHDIRDINQAYYKNQLDASYSTTGGGNIKIKRRAKGYATLRRPLLDPADKTADSDEVSSSINCKNDMQLPDENIKMEMSFSRWEERVGSAELERAVLSLLEFGQITAAKQLQHKLSPALIPSEFVLVDVALKLAAISTPGGLVSISILDEDVRSVMQSQNILTDQHQVEPMQVSLSFSPPMLLKFVLGFETER